LEVKNEVHRVRSGTSAVDAHLTVSMLKNKGVRCFTVVPSRTTVATVLPDCVHFANS